MPRLITRRRLLTTPASRAPALLLGGCDWLGASPSFRDIVLGSGEWLSYRVHRLIGSSALAREYDPSQMSPNFRTNGNIRPALRSDRRHAEAGFADWRLQVDGLVERARAPSRSPSSAPCRRAPRSPATTASRAGAPSASGPACRSRTCSTQVRPAAGRALRRLPLRRRLPRHAVLREHRPRRRLPPADHPRLRHERRRPAASATARRCACASSASSATSTRSSSCASRRSPASPPSARARAASGRTWPTTTGTRGSPQAATSGSVRRAVPAHAWIQMPQTGAPGRRCRRRRRRAPGRPGPGVAAPSSSRAGQGTPSTVTLPSSSVEGRPPPPRGRRAGRRAGSARRPVRRAGRSGRPAPGRRR